MKRLIAGIVFTILASAFNSCAPVVVTSRPRPVIYSPAPQPPPVQTVVVAPVVPVWAPPYIYVNEVHYYYFPDYLVYYDVFTSNYCYYDGFSWLRVTMLPALPVFYGFSPYNSYIVVLNRNVYNPWIQHTYYAQQYPTGYYQTAYTPRTSLGSNTVLRAYDENQDRPLYIDKRSNKEVAVKYNVTRSPRTSISSDRIEKNTISAGHTGRNISTEDSHIKNNERTAANDRGEHNVVKQIPRYNTNANSSERNTIPTAESEGRNISMPRNDDMRNAKQTRSSEMTARDNKSKNMSPVIGERRGGIKRETRNSSVNNEESKQNILGKEQDRSNHKIQRSK